MNPQVLLPVGSVLAAVLPRRWAEALADRLGEFAGRSAPGVCAQFQRNLEHVLGEPVAPETVRGAFRTYVRYYLALMRLAHRAPEAAVGPVRLHGAQQIERSRRRGAGVLVLTAHLGNWDVVGIALARRFGHLCAFVEALEPASLRRFYTRTRRRHAVGVAYAGGASRKPIESLQRNEIIALAADRPFGLHRAAVACGDGMLEVPTGGIRLALRRGAAIHAVVGRRSGSGFVVDVGPDLSRALNPTAPLAQRATKVAAAYAEGLRACIQQHPDQWCLFHPLGRAAEVQAVQQGAA